ncbi:PSD1 and planctomycete cytochrome C domain-containing protein [bacterium]|nr:PSD1 and planctomycete cytochrome C domain-containing protein [bacterium]
MYQLFKCLLLSFGFTAVGLLANPTTEQVEFFEKNIRPALAEHCYECHNSSDKAKGGLALDWRGGLFKGSDSGQVIVAGKPDESLLLRAIRHEEKDIKMPKDGPRLSPVIVRNFERWIAMGAPDPRVKKPSSEDIAKAISWETIREQRKKWWSFQPVRSPVPPRVKGDWAQTDIDKFIQAEWETEGLSPAGNAEPHALIRRLSFVLTGLPPTPEETAAFVQVAEGDRRPAVVNAVERLLASPHFGERWARHWMDWVRYAESLGSEGDPAIPNANQYRNYLIRALNNDVPYDQLLREHIAGDLLLKPRLNMKLGLNESAIGPAHYRFVLQGFAPTDALDELVRTTENQIDVVSKAFLGLTVSCARCHNHKFDPISQEDYHAFYSIMTSCRPATVNIDTSARQETNKAKLAGLKPRIRAALAEQWLTETGTISEQILQPSAEWKKAIEGAKDFRKPLHAWNQLRLAKGEKFTEDWKKLANAFSESKKALDEQRARKYAKRWQLGQDADPLNEWVLDGNGLDGAVAKAGAFRVSPSGDRIVENILPAAVYSHLLSDKHVGVLGSPSFRVEPGQSLFVRVIGGGDVMARYVVQNYTRNGTVYPVTRLKDGKWRWQSWSIKYWEGDDVHLEVTTAGEQAILALNKSKSWFGVSDVIVVQKGQPAPREEPAEFVAPLFAKGDPRNAKRLAKRYAGALRQSIRAWQRGKMTDEQANFLGYFVREGLLPNTLDESPKVADMVKEYRRLEAEVPVPRRAPGVIEAEARDRPLFVRGNHKQPAQTVPRRFLEAINAKPFATKNSGRLELAEAMLHEDNPLTARVIVNRVWHHVFGRGLVATPDNFGKLGETPSHPELLDYLAKRFVAEAWSIKKLIREIALTRTFQLAATPTAKAREMDPDNRLLTSAHVRRLEAEAIRDAMLQVSGSLDRRPLGGSENSDSNRRSLYIRIIRNRLDPFLTVMDAPVPTSTKGRRDVTNVPAQSLTMMNDPFIISLAERLARRVRDDESLKTIEAQITQMFQLALNRQAAVDELAGARAFIGDAAERQKSVQSQLTAFQRQIADSKAEVTAIREPVREQLLAKRKKDGQPSVGGQEPIAAWDFGKGTEDQLGQLNLSLIGGAKVVDGALLLDGKSAFARSAPLAKSLRAKTLEVWVQLSNLDQRGGGSGVGTDAERPHLRRHRFRRAQFETVAGWKR